MLRWALATALVLAAGGFAAFRLSPWPGALLVRAAFDREARRTNAALAARVPAGIAEHLDERYDAADADALLDAFHPADAPPGERLPAIVWIHGGGFVSGCKADVGNYARILAGRGFAVISVDYSLAPGAAYPTPVRQANRALAHLAAHAGRLRVDAGRFVLAGDSAGAHIAAQLAAAITQPPYAAALGVVPSIAPAQLAGTLLYCGPYDVHGANLDGPFGGFLRTVLWSYSGEEDFAASERFSTASVVRHVTASFPPAFVSAGNGDPLEPQSKAFADALERLGVRVERLFFADDHAPPLPHEYQFTLDTDAGRLALERSVAFVRAVTRR